MLKRSRANISMACAPSWEVHTCMPACRRLASLTMQLTGSSSTRSTRAPSSVERDGTVSVLAIACGNPTQRLDRTVLQGAQAELEDQDLRGHLGQCSEDADLDSTDQHATAALPADVLALRLGHGQPGGAIAHESVYPPRPDALDRRAVHCAARSSRITRGHLGIRLMLDSIYGGTILKPAPRPPDTRVRSAPQPP